MEVLFIYMLLFVGMDFVLQFIREYTGKVDELIKEKIEAQSEAKAKENEEKDIIKQQVLEIVICVCYYLIWSIYLLLIKLIWFLILLLSCTEYVCTAIASCFACSTNAGHGRSWCWRWLCPTTTYGWHARYAPIWHATYGIILVCLAVVYSCKKKHYRRQKLEENNMVSHPPFECDGESSLLMMGGVGVQNN